SSASSRASAANRSRESWANAGWEARSSSGQPVNTNSGNSTTSAPCCAASAVPSRISAAFPARSPTVGFSWASPTRNCVMIPLSTYVFARDPAVSVHHTVGWVDYTVGSVYHVATGAAVRVPRVTASADLPHEQPWPDFRVEPGRLRRHDASVLGHARDRGDARWPWCEPDGAVLDTALPKAVR